MSAANMTPDDPRPADAPAKAARAATGLRARPALIAGAVAVAALVAWQASTLISPVPPAAQAQAQTETSQHAPEGSPFAADREAFRAEVRAYLLDNPEVLVEALQAYEARQQALAEAQAREQIAQSIDQIERDGFSFVGGNPEGDVTVVEFLDYNCGFCKRAHSEVKALLERDANVRYVVKEFPILGPSSLFAGRAALAALELDRGEKYQVFHDTMMEHQGQLTEADVQGYALAAGFEWPAVEAGMNTPEVDEKLSQTYDLAARLGINGTPAFVIGGDLIGGYAPVDRLADAVATARTRSQ